VLLSVVLNRQKNLLLNIDSFENKEYQSKNVTNRIQYSAVIICQGYIFGQPQIRTLSILGFVSFGANAQHRSHMTNGKKTPRSTVRQAMDIGNSTHALFQ